MKSHLFCVALLAGASVLAAGATTPAATTEATPKPSNNTPQINLTSAPDVVDRIETPASTAAAAPAQTEASDAGNLPLPVIRLDGNLPTVTVDPSAKPTSEEPAPKPKGGKLWVASMFAFGGGTTLDGVSSWNQREANPILRSASGDFGMRGVMIKASLAAFVLAPQLIKKPQNDRARRIMTIVNFSDGAVYSAVALHNYSMH